MKELKELIKHKLKKNKVIFSKLQFLAGDASNRKYFRLFQKNTSKVVMYDNFYEPKRFNLWGICIGQTANY